MFFEQLLDSALRALALVLALSVGLSNARAETALRFLRTHDMVYQGTDGDVKVVAVDTPGVAGVFVRSGSSVDIQGFSPSELKDDGSETAFFRYDRATNKYIEIISGSTTIKIVGNFTLNLGNALVAIDNANPYMTIAKGNSVLGLVATSVVINNDKAALLQANQFSAYKDIIVPYAIKAGNLTLKGKPITTNFIGLTLETPKNKCLKGANPIYLLQSELAKIRRIKDKTERVAALNRIVKKDTAAELINQIIFIKIPEDTGGPIIGISYQGTVKKISLLNTKSTEKTICVIEDL